MLRDNAMNLAAIRKINWKTVGVCALILLFSPAGWGAIGALQMAPLPRELGWLFQIFQTFYPIGLLIAFLVSVTMPFAILNDVLARTVPRLKNQSLVFKNWPRAILIATLLGSLSIFFFRATFHLRYRFLPNISRNAQPLIFAIEKYQKQNKQFPDSLNELVPKYIAAIPYTSAVGFPDYEYRRIEPDKKRREFLRQETYVLYINTSLGMLNWDRFLYSPNQQYLKQIYGGSGSLEKFGDWTYLHE